MRVFTRSAITRSLTLDAAIAAVADAHRRLARGESAAPAPISVAEPGGEAVFLGMAAVDTVSGLVGVKLLADIPSNGSRSLPTQRSAILVSSSRDGRPVALLDGASVTRIRTAAVSAVATDALSPSSARVLGLIGAGGLALIHVEALSRLRTFELVVVWSRTAQRADELVRALLSRDIKAIAVSTPREVVDLADVVCTLTPSSKPVISGEWLRPGHHINAVGARPRADHREVDSEAIRRSRVILDTREATLKESGDILIPLAEGVIEIKDLDAELGDVLIGRVAGRSDDKEITLFNSLGSGLQDLAMAGVLLAQEGGASFHLDLDG
ncbi:ornithine cyclodeaminase family protein [Microbacterium lacus]|uniref:ornithine cyclodeaminase family protein n=1 Tax=Microbacterium lacus TaxID=415217 RepID=UPI00384E798A